LITGIALANSGSFEVAYRTLGILAPVAILTVWLGTRARPSAVIMKRAS
jgi:hypothetical protein